MRQFQVLQAKAADCSKKRMQIVKLITKKEYDLN